MNIDPGEAVGVFTHDSRDQRDLLVEELVSDPVDGDGKETRIAEDDFVVALGRRSPS